MADQVYFEDVNEGDEIPKLEKNCSTQQLVLWAAGSGDFYQIHYDKDFAQSTGLKGLIIHGALKHAFLGQLVHEITCRGVISKKYQEGDQNFVELDVWTENPQGHKTSPGTATVTLPSRNGG